MRTIISSFRRDCVLIVLLSYFSFNGSKVGLFEGNLFWVGQYDPANHNIKRGFNLILI